MVPYHDQIPLVVQHPSLVVETPDHERHFYRLGVGGGRYRQLYLRVVVGMTDGRIRTVHFVRTVDLVDATVILLELGG